MEFHENKAKQPFIGLVLIWRAYKAWRLRAQTRRVLQQMSDERLRDVGLRRDQVSDFLLSTEAGGYLLAFLYSPYLSIHASG